MPIDYLSQIGASTARTAASPAGAVRPAAEVVRQELPGSGNVLPQQAVPASAEVADVQGAARQLSAYVQNLKRDLHFSVDEDSGRSVVRVVDPESGETIRQMPAEEVLAVSRVLSQITHETKGIILSEKA